MIFDQFLAIDYGTKYIKGLLFRNVLGTASIIRCETLEIVKLEDEETDDYEYNIIRFIQSFFPEEFKFITNLKIDRIYIRDLIIPLTNEKAVREVIPFEVENQLPFPMESMEVLGVLSKIGEENTTVVTFNVEKSELARVMDPFTKGDLRLASLSVDSYVLSSLVQTQNPENLPEYVAQLDIGSEESLFNSLWKGRLCHTRSFHLGSGDINRFLEEELGFSEEITEECKLHLSPYLLGEYEIEPEGLGFFLKRYKITTIQWKKIQKLTKHYVERLARECEKSIFSLLETERPGLIFLSGGGSRLDGLPEFLSRRLEIPVQHYANLPQEFNGDPIFLQAYATGLHYLGKVPQKIDFLETNSARKLSRNEFRISRFLPHIIFTGVSLFILLFGFIFGIVIDKRKISQNKSILVEKYRNGFGEDPPDPDTVMSSAMNKLRQEQKKTEIFRLFLNKESVLDALAEASEHFPDKDTFQFQLTKFIFQDDEIQIYGKVNEYAEIGTVEQALAKSAKFKDIKVLDKRMSTGVNKFKVSFKIRMTVVKPELE